MSLKLKDPFYSFPELDFMRNIKEKFNISSNTTLKVFEEEVYDYATYSIGEYNSDGRDAFMMYYTEFLKPEIIKDKKDQKINKDIELLKLYLYTIEVVEEDIKVLSFCNVPKELEYRLNKNAAK